MKRKKEKSLKPSIRENKRYLLINAGKKQVEKAILDYTGILGWAKAAPTWVKVSILAVNRQEVDNIRAGLELAGIKISRISGSLKKLK